MPGKGFTHLHLHSQYSLLDGAIAFESLLEHCRELGMDSVAVTDHGNMYGAVEFYTKAKAAGIKPIIGFEAYVAPGSRFDKQKTSISNSSFHLLLLAQNNTGYHNLLKLTSAGYTEGFYYRPRIDKEILAELHEGLIGCSACMSGEIPRLIERDDYEAARAVAREYAEIFGPDNFFIELQKHKGDKPQIQTGLIKLAEELNLPLVATNDAHFLRAEDYEAHNCLCCISTGKRFDDPDRMIYPPDVFVKSPEQMRELFSDVPQACDNTLEIARRCNVEIDLESQHSPKFHPPDGMSDAEFLTKLCCEKAEELYPEVTEQVKARIEHELKVIKGKGFSSYFLINWDFCRWAHENAIPVGARGSGVGTIVGYLLGLCDIDPLKYDLLFERFMDPERNEMPDIDIDICQTNRPRLIEYVRAKYGHVAQITTFGTMKARAVIRDVCRVRDIPLDQADRIAKLVPDSLGITLDKAIATEPELKDLYENDPQIRQVIDICKRLEGLVRHASVHAAGVVIAEEPLTNYIPLYKASGSDDLITQYDGPNVEKVGLLKMDFLGLKTLSVLERARSLAEQNHNVKIDLEEIPKDDPKVFDLFARGKTKGVFQFESGGMQDLLMKIKPDRLEDLIAANALYRPGPMTLIPDYIDRKHGASWSTPHPIMTEVLEETYGIMVYQEQVMRICNRLGAIPLREAYTMIKAISKKKHKVIASGREKFIKGCREKGLSNQQAEEIFELIERFAGYGFNKSHSTRYAYIAYQTAYMKTHFPLEFMSAVLTYEMGNTDKVVDYIDECKSMGIEISPPDINESYVDFTPSRAGGDKENDRIRFGLAAVKGVGEKAVEKIIQARKSVTKFQSLFHFCENVDLSAANKQTIEALIKAGAFDNLTGSRAQMVAGLEKAVNNGLEMQSDKQSGQMNFFAASPAENDYDNDHDRLPQVPPWSESQMLVEEKKVLGFYVTSNPLSHHAETINVYSTVNTSQLEKIRQDQSVVIGGMITRIRNLVTKRGKNAGSKMAVFVIEDPQGQAEVVLFPEIREKYADMLTEDKVVFVRGTVDRKRENPNILAEELIALEDVTKKLAARVRLSLKKQDLTDQTLTSIKSLCSRHKGKSPIYLEVNTEKGRVYARADKNLAVNPDVDFCKEMKNLLGSENFRLARN